MKRLAMFCLATLLIAGLLPAQAETTEKPVTGEDDLVKAKGHFRATWVHPDADLARFSKLYLWQEYYQFREGGDTKTGTMIENSRGTQGPFAVHEEDQEKFKKLVTDAVVTQLGRSKHFEIVEEIGPKTLLVRAAFLDIISNVPPNLNSSTRIHIADVGEATFVFELIDAETGVVQARVADRRRIEPPGGMHTVSAVPTTSATVWNDVKVWANAVAGELRAALDKAKKKADKGK